MSIISGGADQDFKMTKTHGVKSYLISSKVEYYLNVGFYPRINVKEHEKNTGHFWIRFQDIKERRRALVYNSCFLAGLFQLVLCPVNPLRLLSLYWHFYFASSGLHLEKRGRWTAQTVCLKLPTSDVRQNGRCSSHYHPPRGEGIYHAWGRCHLYYRAKVWYCSGARSQVYTERRQPDCGDWGGDEDNRVRH